MINPKPLMSLRHLEVFHAIMQTGSTTGAARLLNVSQPTVSKVLSHAEARLGIKLFTRLAGCLHPTPEAEAIYPNVAAIFGRLDIVSRLVRDVAGGQVGTLSIAAAFSIANTYLAKAVATFVADRPAMNVALQTVHSPQVADRVASREVELGVAYEPVVNAEVDTEVLLSINITCVLREDHPLAARPEIDVHELEPYSLITYLPWGMLRSRVDRVLSNAGVVPKMKVQVNVSQTGMMLAYYGAGIALVQPSMLGAMPLPGLVTRPLRPRIELKTLLIRSKSAPQSLAMDAFIAHLKQTVQHSPDLALPSS